MAAAQNAPLQPLVRGYAMGSISMTCYGLEAAIDPAAEDAEGAATLPVVFMTSWHALNNVARMRKGDARLVYRNGKPPLRASPPL